MKLLDYSFYRRDDVVMIARELLGKVLLCDTEPGKVRLVITETEAYAGVNDKASHAWGGRRTPRTEVMYMAGGAAYVYLCYGMHHLFNVVTGTDGVPEAVLIRGGVILSGEEHAGARTSKRFEKGMLIAGPGKVSKALGIKTSMTASSLIKGPCMIEDHGIVVPTNKIEATPRIGVEYAGEDAKLMYRFVANIKLLL